MQYVSSKTVVIKGRFGIFVNRRCWTVDVLRLLSVIQYKKPCKMSMHRSEIYLLLFLFLYVKVFIFWLISLSVLFVSRNELPVFNINQYSFGVWYSSYYIFKVFKKIGVGVRYLVTSDLLPTIQCKCLSNVEGWINGIDCLLSLLVFLSLIAFTLHLWYSFHFSVLSVNFFTSIYPIFVYS